MFHFMRKEKSEEERAEKEERKKRKKEQKERKKRESLTSEDLTRLEEVRRSLRIKVPKAEEYSPIGHAAAVDRRRDLSSVTGLRYSASNPGYGPPTSLWTNQITPDGKEGRTGGLERPFKSILKSKEYSLSGSLQSDLDDPTLLLMNTRQNELVLEYQRQMDLTRSLEQRSRDSTSSPNQRSSSQEAPEGENAGRRGKHLRAVGTAPALGTGSSSEPPTAMEVVLSQPDLQRFGVSLRRVAAAAVSGGGGQEAVLIEPAGAFHQEGKLVPGMVLLSINRENVGDKTRNQIVAIIKAAEGDLVLNVAILSEFCELNRLYNRWKGELTNSSGSRYSSYKVKSEEQLRDERVWQEAEQVWLVHREGFSSAKQVNESGSGGSLPEGKVRIRLDCNDEVIEVEEDDVEKANPPTFDRVEDLAQLRYLNESSVLHTLMQRYASNLIHTFAGPTLITINPAKPLAIYSDKIITMFKGCRLEDMPPHIYAAGQTAYRTLIATKKDQSIAFIGRSGSGKTVNFRHVLSYLSHTAGSANGILSPERLTAIHTLLEAFGNSRTVMNANASRFSQIFSVDFDHSGLIVSASVQVLMLEKNRVVRRPEGEPNFNIFYYMLAGMDTRQRREYQIDNLTDPNIFLTPLQRTEEKTAAAAAFTAILKSAELLSMTNTELRAIWSVLAAIYHLGAAGVTQYTMGRAGFAKSEAAQKAAMCLGTNMEDLTRAVFHSPTSSGTLSRRNSRTDSASLPDGVEALESFAVALYSEAVSVLLALINRTISSSANTAASILVVDTPGFQNPATCGRPAGATFEELCHNYTQERLQMLFHQRTITALKERYEAEQVDVGELGELAEMTSPAPLLQLIDKQSVMRSSQADLSQTDRRGLLWLLDEESIFPGSTDESFVERLLLQFSDRDAEDLIKQGPTPVSFILQHFQGTNPVLYSSAGWLKASRETTVSRHAVQALHESQDKGISDLFLKYRSPGSATVSGSIVGSENSHTLRRASSIRRAFTSGSAGMKRYSAALQVKFHVDSLMEQLRRTRIKFIHCFLPQHTAGLSEVKTAGKQAGQSGLNIPLIRSQLRGAQILEAVRLHKIGFPESFTYQEFWRRFSILGGGSAAPSPGQERGEVERLLASLDIDQAAYRLGVTQVFLRGGVLTRLDEERDGRLAEQVVRLQACARGYIARKNLQKLKTQDIAIRCIQKNVRKFMGVRDWPWWRLLIKVTPMLNVHRTEEQLKQREDEVEILKQKLEKAEREKQEYKELTERQEARLSEMTADLAEEQTAAQLATERLETEQADRMRLEREKADLLAKNRTLATSGERLEMELLHSRAAEINGNYSEDGEGDGIYRSKYERAMKELEYSKKRLAQQHEDDLEQLLALKKQLEKKLNDAYEEVDEQRQVVAQWKRKSQKIQGEMNDMRLLLEEQTSRNTLLEKKQKKFDSELAMVQEDKRQETLAKEKLLKELDTIRIDKNRLEDSLKAMKLDVELKDEKINGLQRDLEELQLGGASEDEVRILKKQKMDLELRLKDQEEELDDLAGQVQMLEAAKTKLEMQVATIKKDHKRELQSKEDELEDTRAAANKKLKILEQQLEQEHEERIGFLRERHELEGKIMTLQDMLERSGDEEQVSKLKKDLKRTKALLRDAQTMLEKTQNEGTNKVILRQLKNQLEDAEFARTAAMKARQNAELELADTHSQLEDVSRSKQELEDRHLKLAREKAELASQLQENEEELQDVMRKYKASVAAVSTDQITIQDQQATIQELEDERNRLREQLAELSSRLSCMEGENVSTAQHKRLELKIRELESKLELEVTTRGRLDTQITRLKEQLDKTTKECDELRLREQNSQEAQKKLSRQLRDLKEDFTTLQGKETELMQKKGDLEKQLELAEAETLTVRSDLKLAMKRIEDLQVAISGELDSDSHSGDSDSSDEDMHSFMEHHRRAMSVQRERESMARESMVRESVGRGDSVLRESMTRELRSARDSVGRSFSILEETRESTKVASSSFEVVAEGDEESHA